MEEEAQQHKERKIEKKEPEQRLQGMEELAKEKRLSVLSASRAS